MKETPILVTAGVIRKDGLILIAQRKKDSFLEPNKWEFPGGKVEYLEHPEDCLVREIKEELGIDIAVDKLLTVNSHIYTKEDRKFHVILMAFLADHLSGEVKNIECQDSKWVTPEELSQHEFVAADISIAEKLLSELR